MRPVRQAAPIAPLMIALAFGAFATPQAGASSFSYDFENLQAGVLVGQDGWLQTATWFSPSVLSAGVVEPSKTSGVLNAAQGNATGANRPFGSTFTYTAADTAVVLQFDSLIFGTDAAQTTLVGLTSGPTSFGRQGGQTLLLTATGFVRGDTILTNNWYQFRLELDFSVAGVNSSLFYRNLTAGEAAFTADSLISNINLGLTANDLGEYAFTSINIRQDTNVGGTYIDNINVGVVPAPPALVLLGTGVVALVARSRQRR